MSSQLTTARPGAAIRTQSLLSFILLLPFAGDFASALTHRQPARAKPPGGLQRDIDGYQANVIILTGTSGWMRPRRLSRVSSSRLYHIRKEGASRTVNSLTLGKCPSSKTRQDRTPGLHLVFVSCGAIQRPVLPIFRRLRIFDQDTRAGRLYIAWLGTISSPFHSLQQAPLRLSNSQI